MISLHPWYEMSERQILAVLGSRLKAIRLNLNMSQKELGDQVGKGADEISRIEHGKPITMISFLRLLRALNKLESFDNAIAAPEVSPLQMLKREQRKRKRASKPRRTPS